MAIHSHLSRNQDLKQIYSLQFNEMNDKTRGSKMYLPRNLREGHTNSLLKFQEKKLAQKTKSVPFKTVAVPSAERSLVYEQHLVKESTTLTAYDKVIKTFGFLNSHIDKLQRQIVRLEKDVRRYKAMAKNSSSAAVICSVCK